MNDQTTITFTVKDVAFTIPSAFDGIPSDHDEIVREMTALMFQKSEYDAAIGQLEIRRNGIIMRLGRLESALTMSLISKVMSCRK